MKNHIPIWIDGCTCLGFNSDKEHCKVHHIEDIKKLEKIRKRQSYKMFKGILEAFDESTYKGMASIYHMMNNQYMFRTQTRADYALESLIQLLKDNKLN
jgi:hypothetical protein